MKVRILPVLPVALCFAATFAVPSAQAEIIADSVAGFSGVQGQDGWSHGYRNAADPAQVDYDPAGDFTEFPEDWWDGGQWNFPGGDVPWTELGPETTHPNGDNNVEVHWTIRRWEPQIATITPVGVTWHIHKGNPGCGNGVTGSLHVNGIQLDTETIAFDDATGVDRTYYINLQPGDVLDLALQPLGTDGSNNDGCDGSVSRFIADDDLPDNPVQPDGTPFFASTAEDSDGDGMSDDWEMSFFPGDLTQLTADGDFDSDGLSDPDEFTRGLDPTDPDFDKDGLLDGVETNTGVFVSAENTGTDPKRADTDGDGLSDGDEVTVYMTNPLDADTDGDGYGDGSEVARGFDPADPADNPPVSEIANSFDDWSAGGVQGENSWFYGYRNKTLDGGGDTYNADAGFIPFPTTDPSWWTGAQWDNPGGVNPPWTEVGQETTHPNGNNNGNVHWTIRRWIPDVEDCTPLALTWHMRKTNPAGNGVSGGVYLNGAPLDFATIAGADTTGVERTVFVNINPGDIIDIVLTPMGTDGTDNDGADGSANRLAMNTRIPAVPLQPDGSLFISCLDPDSDGDGLPDSWEHIYFPGDLTQLSGAGDYDSDGLSDRGEFDMGSDPTVQDSDGDGLLDGVETNTGLFVDASNTGSNPVLVDTDGDGLGDGEEVNGDPPTNPVKADTDDDGYPDGVELAEGTDPTDPASNPGVFQIADSRRDWSINGVQGENNFRYGYYNVPLEVASDPAQTDYDPVSDFTEYPQDWWTGNTWDFPGGDVPWTTHSSTSTHPNGDNNGEVHWSIRRWVAEVEEITPVAITWHTAKENLGCGNGVTGGIHVSGMRLDAVSIASNDGTGVTRTYYYNVEPGDAVDLINSPLGPDMSNADGCDGSVNWLLIDTRIPENAMQPDGTPFEPFIPSDPHLTVSSQTPFGELDVSPGPVTRAIAVRNSGSTLDLEISGATVTGADAGHYQVLSAFPITLAPREEGVVEVRLDPMDRDGGFIAALDIASNDPDEPVKAVDLSAKIPNANRLLAHFRLDEASGTQMLDASGGGLHGTYVENGGTVALGQPALATGSAVEFDDAGGTASAYGEVTGLPALASFSVSMWLSQDSGDDANSVLFSKGTDAQTPANPFALILAGGTLAWGVGGNVEQPDVQVASIIDADTAYHLVVTYEAGVSTAIFLDGTEVGRNDSPTVFDDSRRQAMQFGAMAGTLGFAGVLDDIQIYAKALTAEEASFLFANPGQVLGGGDVEPSDDSDGDGQSDASEELAGTDPNDASDYLRVLETRRTEGGVELNWSAKDGREYDVLYSPNMTAASWEVIATLTASGDSATYEDTDPARTGAEEGYYRSQAK
ncbi:MAG TPA: LamG-like jellyroll fold domain-containing protein [Verrucomicrobiales bacterium]|nr:LamG-like jellyroll fold domain-containing protein [Verrucomicrobiales bacterium]